jgi:DnaK suppressor protein
MKTRPHPATPARSSSNEKLPGDKPVPGPNFASAEPIKVDRKWGWHYRTLLGLRQRLTAERDEHRLQASAPLAAANTDFEDRGTAESERDVLFAELSAEENMLGKIDAALERLRTGTYGICEETGQAIPTARLRALPWTQFSRDAAKRREKDAKKASQPTG